MASRKLVVVLNFKIETMFFLLRFSHRATSESRSGPAHWSVSARANLLPLLRFLQPPPPPAPPTESIAVKPGIYPRRRSMTGGQLFSVDSTWNRCGSWADAAECQSQTQINESVMRSEAADASPSLRGNGFARRVCDLTASAHVRDSHTGLQQQFVYFSS